MTVSVLGRLRLTLWSVYASLATGYSGTLRGAPAMPGDAMEPDEPQTGWGATSAVDLLKT